MYTKKKKRINIFTDSCEILKCVMKCINVHDMAFEFPCKVFAMFAMSMK